MKTVAELLIGFFMFAAIGGYCAELTAQSCMHVIHVTDGDTVILKDGRSVRYLGIDAPEIDHEERVAQPFGYEALENNKHMVFNRQVCLVFDLDRYDRYGRTLAYVFLQDGTFVNLAMLESGLAYFLTQGNNVKYDAMLLDAQQRAISAGAGIWRYWGKRGGSVVGNFNSKRFHERTCPYGKRIAMRNRVTFSRIQDAFWAGYAPCKHCIKR